MSSWRRVSGRETIGGPGPAPPVLRPAGGPVRLPRAPAVRRSARGFCGLLALVGPSGGPPERRSPSGLRPAPRPVGPCRASPAGSPASVGLGLSPPALARRSGPRCPPAAPAGGGGLPLRPFGPPLWGGAGLSPLRARPGAFASPGRPGPPARPAASGGGFALAPPARGLGATAPLPAPARGAAPAPASSDRAGCQPWRRWPSRIPKRD